MFKKLIVLIFFCGFSYSQKLSPVFKSAIIPGWGQLELENDKKHKMFMLIEFSSLTACFASYGFSKHLQNKYKSFAARYANVESSGKNRKFWVDIGNYMNTSDHDEEHLRWRENEKLYNEALWSWDSELNMKKFEKIRIKSDQLNIQGKFIVGFIVVNHLISSIDAFYLKKLKEEKSLKLFPSMDIKNPSIKMVFIF